MSDGRWQQVLRHGLTALGLIDPSHELEAKLYRLIQLLLKWNKAFNLTAITQVDKAIVHHILDSLVILPYLPVGSTLDFGCGAGFPGLPLAIARPELRVDFLDSNAKKLRFVHHALHQFGLQSRCQVLHRRVQEHAVTVSTPYSSLVCRAVTALPNMVEMTQHLRTPETQLLALKGQLPKSELNELPDHVIIEQVISLTVPGLAAERHLVILRS